MDCIVNQMMAVAEYLGWDASELKPVRKMAIKKFFHVEFWIKKKKTSGSLRSDLIDPARDDDRN